MKNTRIFFIALFLLQSSTAFAKDSDQTELKEMSNSSSSELEQINVDSIKEKYWARGNETELGVVQNRTFSKKGKAEFSLLGGVLYSDPFLDIKAVGASVSYHLSEYIAVELLGLKHRVGPSSALNTFQEILGATTNSNSPRYYLGAEAMGSIFYGKLSVLGHSIIYYDLYGLGGIGATNTESGTYATPSAGFGQRFYLNKFLSIRLDYRLMYYRETIVEKVVPTMLGQSRGMRDNWSNTVILGISFMPFGN
jgi:outer membrane beta-barrel protein